MCSFDSLCWNGERGHNLDLDLKYSVTLLESLILTLKIGSVQGLDVNCPGRFEFSLAEFLVPVTIRLTHKIYNT